MERAYLNVLNPEQLQAVKHTGSPLLILAGAGSGKTRVITTKIAYLIDELGVSPYSILAVTFTKKAAAEMHERAIRLSEDARASHIRTFHSFGSWFLRMYAEEAGLSSSFTVYDDDDAVTLVAKSSPELTRVQAAAAAHKIARAKDYCLTPDSAQLSTIDTDPDFADVYARYQERLRSTGNVDFGDLIMLPSLILAQNEQIRSQIQNRFKVILVDEYQDSNVAQFELLKHLAGPNTYLCVVGDDDQSIYRFRGAEVKNILTFQESFENTELVRLERNYRSVSPILNAADNVVRNNSGRLGKTLIAERGKGKKPKLVFLNNQDEEATFCAEIVQQAHEKGCPYSDWAILYRTNAQSLGFETEFLQRKIPYKVVGSLKFYDREEIKDILAYLALIANLKDEISFERIVNKPTRALGKVTQQKIVDAARSIPVDNEHAETGLLGACRFMLPALPKKAKQGLSEFTTLLSDLITDIDSAPQTESATATLAQNALAIEFENKGALQNHLGLFIQAIIERSGLQEYHSVQDEIAATQRVANMQELANSATLYPKNRVGLTQFLDHIELDRAAVTDTEEVDSVTLITLHNTKGLEFPRVIITGLERGIFPREDKNDEELEEERRLFYVGITRAQDELYMSACGMRRLYGKTAFMEPSPFLNELNHDEIDILGKKPFGFGRRASVGGTSLTAQGRVHSAQKYSAQGYGQTAGVTKKDDPIADKWKVGANVYHDDFGYGVISRSSYDDEEYIITVAFETGEQKRFMPKYNCKDMMIVRK